MNKKSQKSRSKLSTKNFSLKSIQDIITSNQQKKLEGCFQTDIEFIKDLAEVEEHSSTVNKEVFAKRATLSQDEYEMIERIGDVHYDANKFNDTSCQQADEINEDDKCQCGCKRGRGKPLPYCLDEQEQNFFGPGIILFFFFIKRVLLVVLISILIYGIYSLITNLTEHNGQVDCENPGALSFLCEWKIQAQVAAKTGRQDLMLGQLILGMIMCIFWSISLRYIRAVGRIKEKKIDDQLDSSSDYSMFIQNLPYGTYSEMDIFDFLYQKWKTLETGVPLKIKSVQVIYNMSEIREKIQQIQTLAKSMISYFKVKPKKVTGPMELKEEKCNKYKQKKQRILKVCQEVRQFRKQFLQNSQFRSKRSSACTVVHFYDSDQRFQFVKNFGTIRRTMTKQLLHNVKSCCPKQERQAFLGQRLKIYRAPEPSDIFWRHCEQPLETWRTLAVWGINLFLVGCSFGCLMLVSHLKETYPEVKSLSIITIIILNLFNRLIWNVLLNIIVIEKNNTKTANVISVMNKSYFTQAINLIVVPMIINVSVKDNIDGADGLMGQIHDFQLTSFIFMVLFNLINVPHRIVMFIQCVKCLRRMAIRYFCRVTGELDNIDQFKDAITFLYDPPPIPLAGFYVYITTVISQAAFFCHLSPIILVYLFGNMIIFHLINRYLILRMSKIPDMIDFLVFESVVEYALNFPLLYGVGSIVFLSLRDDAPNFGYYVPSIVCIIVWFLSVQSPFGMCRKIVETLIDCLEKKPAKQAQPKDEKQISQGRLAPNPESGEPNLETETEEVIKMTSKLFQHVENIQTKRKENYFANNGTLDLFNFENRIREVSGPHHNQYKAFCERFKCEQEYKPTYCLNLD